MRWTGEDLQVDWWPIEKVVPYASSPRKLGPASVAKVAASLAEFGWRQPIVVDEHGVIIVGHTRVKAARTLEHAVVPVHVARGLTPAQAKAYRIADNRTSQDTTWDLELLPLELEGLKSLGSDLGLLGFDADELESLMGLPREAQEDTPPEPPEVPVSREGDLWLLGDHRLLCGDSTKAEAVARVMDGKRATLMATDPPYLVGYTGGGHPAAVGLGGDSDKGWQNELSTKDKHWDDYVDHESSITFYADFLRVALELALVESVPVYQCHGIMRTDIVLAAWRAVGLLPHQILIWKKSRAVLTHAHYMWDYEPFIYGWPQGNMPKKRPPANATCVWEIDSKIEDGAGSIHPTMKPVELIRRPILYHTKRGELIYEPFSGSGTAIIAAETTGRNCCALDLSPAFVDAAVLRWEAFTGQEAHLDGEGLTFAEARER